LKKLSISNDVHAQHKALLAVYNELKICVAAEGGGVMFVH
jgi:hypothetical protein